MSVSFQNDAAAIKMMLHLIIKSVYKNRLSYLLLKDIDKDFVGKYDKDVIT
jgi:hypothetical protein